MEACDSVLCSPVVRAGYEYWLKKKADRLLPSRQDMQPAEMLPFIGGVCLFDVRLDPLDFRYRLIGTQIVRYLSRDYTGTWMSSLEHQKPGNSMFENFRKVTETGKPSFNANPYVGPHAEFIKIQELVAPLSDDGRTVNMLFAVVDFIRK